MARTVPFNTSQFITIPVGFLSMADFLERNGFKTRIYNLGELMLSDRYFEVEGVFKRSEAKIFAIDLHWCVHVQGAIELARVCKQVRPFSKVVLGGLTSTCFHSEILEKFDFIDFVIRGEAENPLLQLARRIDKNLEGVPNLTYRTKDGRVKVNLMEKPVEALDEFEFTRLDLVEPCNLLVDRSMGGVTKKWWCIPFCRGCAYNCAGCGASAYSYRKMFNRERPAFRSPGKIAEDIQKLSEQGVNLISIFQDPRIGGRKYLEELIATLRREKTDADGIDMELFSPASEEYLKSLSSIGIPLALTISPESGVETVRRVHGREYSNDEILRTVELCQKYNIDIGIFFLLALAEENQQTIRQTWDFWEKLYQLNFESQSKGSLVKPEFGFMLLLDPGSLAFDYSEKYGYKLLFKNLEDYYRGMSMPSWHLWLGYETKYLGRKELLKLILQSLEKKMELEEKYRTFEHPSENASYGFERFKIKVWHAIAEKVDEIQTLSSQSERDSRLLALRDTLEEYVALDRTPEKEKVDPYGYKRMFDDLVHQSIGLMSGA